MTELSRAEDLNEDGLRTRDEGDLAGAEASFRAAMADDPAWSAPAFNLGLLHKYNLQWAQSLEGERVVAAEDWGTTTRISCPACSTGVAHDHADSPSTPAHPHCGLAARNHGHADSIIRAWLAQTPLADLIVWYEAPSTI